MHWESASPSLQEYCNAGIYVFLVQWSSRARSYIKCAWTVKLLWCVLQAPNTFTYNVNFQNFTWPPPKRKYDLKKIFITFPHIWQQFKTCRVVKINFFISNIHFATQLFAASSTLLPREAAPPSLPYDLFTWLFNPLAYTAACEAAGLARSINTQPAVRRNSETNPTSQHNRGMYWSQ